MVGCTRTWTPSGSGPSGIVAGLRDRGLDVLAPDRLPAAPTWAAEVDHLLPLLPSGPIVLVGGSNGCSVAVRLVLAQAHRVVGLVLAWPATAGDPVLDAALHEHLGSDELLTGETLRGLSDAELAGLRLPVAVVPSEPPNRVHQRHTVDAPAAAAALRHEWPGSPEPPHPNFSPMASYRELARFTADQT
jgi:pimeloyl-ACP methyl ester carboxylesterase